MNKMIKPFPYEKVVNGVKKLSRGIVWCVKCGRSQKVDSANCLKCGWPECCGGTMTIDSPEERQLGADMANG